MPTQHEDLAYQSSRRGETVVGFSLDSRYYPGAVVMLRSLLENCAQPGRLEIVGINAGLSNCECLELRRMARGFGARLKWIEFPVNAISLPMSSEAYIKARLGKLYFAELLPKTYCKLVYLDCDTIILGDIQELGGLDVRGSPIIAASNILSMPTPTIRAKRSAKLTLLPDVDYFNPGVLVINLEYWRRCRLRECIEQQIKVSGSNAARSDTVSMNAVLSGQWDKLDPSWNYQVNTSGGNSSHPDINLLEIFLSDDVHSTIPKLIHLTSPKKPWELDYTDCAREVFFYFLDRTHLKAWRPN